MDSDLPLVLKVNNYLNYIDKKLDQPINNFYYTAKYSFNHY